MRNGLVYEYGNSADSRVEATGSTTIPKLWALNKISDPNGNYVLFNYTEDNANGVYRPISIQYTGNTGQGVAPPYTIQFVYEARHASDPLVGYSDGYKRKETNRLAILELRHNGSIVRRFWPYYGAAGTTDSNRTYATSIYECGLGDALCHDTVALAWEVYPQGIEQLSFEYDVGQSIPTGTVVHTIDANADGRLDMVYPSGGTWRVRYFNGNPYDSEINTAIAATNPGQSHSIDYSGDGFRDVLFPDGSGNWRVLQFAATGVIEVLTGKPANGAAGGLVAVRDVNGDGLDDIVSANGATLNVRLNSTSGLAATESTVYTTPSGWVFDTDAFGVAGVEEYRRRQSAIDLNGDQRGDLIAKLRQTSTSTIAWKTLVSMGTSFVADLDIESAATHRPLVLDLNGDALTDAIGHNGASWVLHFPRGGYDPAARSIWDPAKVYPAITDALAAAVPIDFNRDGASDVLVDTSGLWRVAYSTRDDLQGPTTTPYAAPANHVARSSDIDGNGADDLSYLASGTWRYRQHGSEMTDIVHTVSDAVGNSHHAIQFSSTMLATRDSEPVFPVRRFTQALPTVGWVYSTEAAQFSVRYVTLTNSNWHVQGRGYLGFAKVRDDQTRSTGLGGTITQSVQRLDATYSQVFPTIGAPLVQSSFVQDPLGGNFDKFAETTSTFSSVAGGSGFEARAFPYVSSANAKRWEIGGALHLALVSDSTTTTTVDTYGTPYDVTMTTTEPSSANGIQADVVHTHRTYTPLANLTNDTTNWCLGQLKKIQQIRSHTAFGGASQTRTTDQSWDTVKCRVTGQTIQPGHATLQVIKAFAFDGFGNRNSESVTGIGMAVRTTLTNWGTAGRFPTTVTNPLSQATTMGYDLALGVQTSTTDPNGIVTSSRVLDARGRVTRENRPDGTATTRSYEACGSYGYCGAGDRFVVIEKTLYSVNAVLSERHQVVDGVGQSTQLRTKSLSGAFTLVETKYNGFRQAYEQSAPCWAASCNYFFTTTAFDRLARPVGTSRPTSDSDATPVTTSVFYEGLTTRSLDPLGKETRSIAKVVGGLARSTDHNGYYQTTDHDPFGNAVRVQDSAGVTLQSATFDIRGNRTAKTDPDLGSWTYVPNALGEIVSQTDANAKVTTFVFDKLSRMTSRVEPEGAGSITSTWTWGTSAHNTATNKYIGTLKQQSISGTGVTTFTEAFTNDALSRRTQVRTTEGANNYDVNTSYHAATGYLETLTYPTSTSSYRLKLQYEYQNGRLVRVKDFNAPTTVFWQANNTDARQIVINQSLGNGLTTQADHDAVTARLNSIATGPGGSATIQNLGYLFDNAGNVIQRQDNNQGLSENFYYDNLHRLDNSTLGGSQNLDVALDNQGNITTKSDAGTYTYHPTKIHAVTSIAVPGGGTMTFTYDNNGNMLNRNGTTLAWLTNNLPKSITKDANNSSTFQYGPHRQRWQHVYKTAGTTFTHTYIGKMMEKVVSGGVTEFKHFIHVNGASLALYSRKSTGTNATYYRHDDHLGSTEHLTDNAGANVVMESFGAYGKRRGTNWTGTPTPAELTTINNTTRKGFTEHEHLDSTDLVHMNGRVFDPLIGRFVSSDPNYDCGLKTQGWNRYSYVGNKTLSAKDPSGFQTCHSYQYHVNGFEDFNWGYFSIEICWPDIFDTYSGFGGGGGGFVAEPVASCEEATDACSREGRLCDRSVECGGPSGPVYAPNPVLAPPVLPPLIAGWLIWDWLRGIGADPPFGNRDECLREIDDCMRLCVRARSDPDQRNVWGGSWWRCMAGCVSFQCQNYMDDNLHGEPP